MRLEVTITAHVLNIRSGAGTNFKIVGTLTKNSKVIVNELNGNWYKLEDGRGWISKSYTTNPKNLETTTQPQPTPTTPQPTQTDSLITDTGSVSQGLGIDSKILNMLYTQVDRTKEKLDASTRLFGCPFQFTKTVDFRLNSLVDLGRMYMQNIIAESPIVYFVPGKPNYLAELSDAERKSLTTFFAGRSLEEGDSATLLNDILGGKDVRYFDFVSDYAEYMRYVNLLCRMAAIYIGIGDEKVNGTDIPYKYYDWTFYKYKNDYKEETNTKKKSIFDWVGQSSNELIENLFGKYKYVQFYVEPNTSFIESASNNTTQSKIAGMFDTVEGLMKEISFFTQAAALKYTDEVRLLAMSGMEDINDILFKNTGENLFSRILGVAPNVLNGSNILFPELWGDSSYNKSYNVTINLVSPYGDKESIYLNVIVPLMHLLALCLPKQTTANTFASPFLVKVFAKGWFSCEMGIIDSISIDKAGSGDSWSVHGLANEMKVTLGIRDLYSNLMITNATRPDLFFQNNGLIDFLAVTCGVDITKPNFLLKLETIYSVFFGKALDLPKNMYNEMIQAIRRQIEPLISIE